MTDDTQAGDTLAGDLRLAVLREPQGSQHLRSPCFKYERFRNVSFAARTVKHRCRYRPSPWSFR